MVADRAGDGRRPGFTLVLGGGGVPGLAYLAGALQALDEAGLDPSSADLVVGTSAGALTGALLRLGCPLQDLAERAIGRHLLLGDARVLRPSWRSGRDLAARVIGTSWVVGQATSRRPLPSPPAALERLFPAGLAAARNSENITSLPAAWPADPLWVVAVDLANGRRVALGSRPEDLGQPLGRAVRASTAVPGVFAPVRFGGRVLVDGGVHSSTNLDLAGTTSGVVVCVAPMAYDPTDPPRRARALARRTFQASVERETAQLREEGVEVLVLRPGREELRDYSPNFLRAEGAQAVGRAAFDKSRAQLQSPAARRVLRLASGTGA